MEMCFYINFDINYTKYCYNLCHFLAQYSLKTNKLRKKKKNGKNLDIYFYICILKKI